MGYGPYGWVLIPQKVDHATPGCFKVPSRWIGLLANTRVVAEIAPPPRGCDDRQASYESAVRFTPELLAV